MNHFRYDHIEKAAGVLALPALPSYLAEVAMIRLARLAIFLDSRLIACMVKLLVK
jgi:hypothetical protein